MDTATAVDVAATAASSSPAVGAAIGAVAGALLVALASLVVFRVWNTPFSRLLRVANRTPRLAVGVALGSLIGLALVTATAENTPVLHRTLVLLLITAVTWYAVSVLRAVEQAALGTWDTTGADNLLARRRRTQFLVLRRAGSAIVIIIGLGAALLTFPAVRAVGQSVLASAGVIGIVVGVAAQGALKNLIAGIQIALAQPIRLDDAVLVEGEWGTIEDITLTTVVVRVWDGRRLVHPTSWFTENPFQNWTRSSAELLGQVTLVLDHTADVPALRAAAERIITTHPLWNGHTWAVQVVDATEQGITVRALMSAADSPTAWDLRCDVREQLVAWVVSDQPGALPRHRLGRVAPDGDGDGDGVVDGDGDGDGDPGSARGRRPTPPRG